MFTQLKELLPKEINKQGLHDEIHAIAVISEYKNFCQELLGEDALLNLMPRFVRDGILHIDASSASWAQHLHLKQISLIEKINEKLEESVVSKFSIHIKNNA